MISMAYYGDTVAIRTHACTPEPMRYSIFVHHITTFGPYYYGPPYYDLAHVAGWEPYSLPGAGHVSWVGSVLYRSSCTASISVQQG